MTTSTITLSRTVAAAPQRVFAAWTEAEQLAAWWWPQLAGTTYDVDARLGRAVPASRAPASRGRG